jgi:hypothetical protein
MEGSMNLGFESARDVLEVLLVPIALALLAVGWPAIAERRKRMNFENLTRRELMEAKPNGSRDAKLLWHEHLSRRFLHEEIIGSVVDNADFVLSLDPELSYHVSQLWIEFAKAQKESKSGVAPSPGHACQFSWHLLKAAEFLDDRRRRTSRRGPGLVESTWRPWDDLIRNRFPGSPQCDFARPDPAPGLGRSGASAVTRHTRT